MTDTSYSEAFPDVPPEWIARYYRVQPSEGGRYYLAGPCPKCLHLLRGPLGEPVKRRRYRRKQVATNESKSTTVICGCGEAHLISDQDTRFGCGRRWNMDLTILLDGVPA